MADLTWMETLTREESLRLLGSVWIGRVAFTHLALPAIRPVHHLVDGERIIIRTPMGRVIAAPESLELGTVVAYQADATDPVGQLSWTVTVVGRATHVLDPLDGDRYRQVLPNWANMAADDIIAIQADLVDGFRLARDRQSGQPWPATG